MNTYIDSKPCKIGEKDFILHKAPATVGYEVALRYAKAKEENNIEELQKCLYILLKYVELDLKDGRTVALSDESIINQHITDVSTLVALQAEIVTHNFDFFVPAEASNS